MKHSVEAYMLRMPIEKMEDIFQAWLRGELQEEYRELLPDILRSMLLRAEQGDFYIPSETRAVMIAECEKAAK